MANAKQEQKCKVENCKRPYRAKGYCTVHYKKWRNGEFGKARYKTCKNEGCHKPMKAGGMCAEHHEAWVASRKGTASAAAASAPAPAPAEATPAS